MDDRVGAAQTDGALALASSYRFVREVRLRPARRVEILAYLSGALDLAEAQPTGHAARVAYLGYRVAEALSLGSEERRRIMHLGLLHAAGAAMRTTDAGESAALVAERLQLDAQVAEAARAVEERWDGRGGPLGLSGVHVPLESLCVAAAHWAAEFAERASHPLRARAALQRVDTSEVTPVAGPEVGAALVAVLRHDATWLALWDDDLPAVMGGLGAGEGKPSRRKVLEVVAALGDVVDAAVREPGRSERVAALSHLVASRLGMPEGFCDAIEVAGYLLDLGQLGVPRAVTEKPSILTVDEMEQMRRHPGLGARLLAGAPGFDEIATWVEQHHERPDGRGYPEMLTLEELPLPPRILAVADAYWALRAHRPYRHAFSHEDAMATLEAGAGRQFDAEVVAVLPAAVAALEEIEQDARAAG